MITNRKKIRRMILEQIEERKVKLSDDAKERAKFAALEQLKLKGTANEEEISDAISDAVGGNVKINSRKFIEEELPEEIAVNKQGTYIEKQDTCYRPIKMYLF